MEQLMQKYIRYFYLTMIGSTVLQLIDLIIVMLNGHIFLETFFLLFFSVTNLILLCCNMKHNKKQQFTECKFKLKIMRYTLGIFVLLQLLLCFMINRSWIMFGNHLIAFILVELTLTYRIKSIEHLETLANKFIIKETDKYAKY